jgi:hypothetical protein
MTDQEELAYWKLRAKRLSSENERLREVCKAAVTLVCAPAWAGISDEDCELERVLRESGYVEST